MFGFPALIFRRLIWLALMIVAAGSVTVEPASASFIWDWSYSGAGVVASGTFTTNDTPDGTGFYLITSITGTRNGQTITGLQPTGTSIPGNEPFAVDNLVSLNGPQLTHNGFGYAATGGNYANPFFADFLSPARYLDFFSAPPFTSELPISFSATLTAVPEPEIYALLFLGLGILSRSRCRKNVGRASQIGSNRARPMPRCLHLVHHRHAARGVG